MGVAHLSKEGGGPQRIYVYDLRYTICVSDDYLYTTSATHIIDGLCIYRFFELFVSVSIAVGEVHNDRRST